MRLFTLILSVFLTSVLVQAQDFYVDQESKTIQPSMVPLPVHVGGRVAVQPLPQPYNGNSYMHQWPGVYFEADFNGTRVFMKFDDTVNEYRLLIDDQTPETLLWIGKTEIAITNLAQGKHHIRVEKVTESIEYARAFQGFYVPSHENVETFPARKRQIEFIGDSSMTGYGLRAPTRSCSQEEVRLLSDTQQSYPALVAKQFAADYQINAISGRGLVRNYDGFDPEIALPKIYPFALFDKTAPYHDASWKPQITFVALGANDFATDLKPTEKWKTDQELFQNYLGELKRFLTVLHKQNPNTALLLSWTDMIFYMADAEKNLAAREQIEILAAAKRIGFITVAFVPMDNLNLKNEACDYHASASDHQILKAWLGNYIAAHTELWQGQ